MDFIVTFYGANGDVKRLFEDCIDEAYAEMYAENMAEEEGWEIINIERYFGSKRDKIRWRAEHKN